LESIDPWGERRADYRAAVICWVIASVNSSSRGRRPQLKDFLKMFEFDSPQEGNEEQLERALARVPKKGWVK